MLQQVAYLDGRGPCTAGCLARLMSLSAVSPASSASEVGEQRDLDRRNGCRPRIFLAAALMCNYPHGCPPQLRQSLRGWAAAAMQGTPR